MNERIGVKVRFGAGLLPALANAEHTNVRALQRLLSPMIYNVLQQAYVRADSETLGLGRNKLVRRFQERLSGAAQWQDARADLLAQLLVAQDDRAGVQYVDQLQKAMHTRVHVLVAAHPELGALFDSAGSQQEKQQTNEARGGNDDDGEHRVRYRVRADSTPAEFLHAVYLCAAQAAYDDPFLFVQDVRALAYVENRRRCLARIDQCVERVLFDKCNAMVNRLWREIAQRVPRTVTEPTAKFATSRSSTESTNDAAYRSLAASKSATNETNRTATSSASASQPTKSVSSRASRSHNKRALSHEKSTVQQCGTASEQSQSTSRSSRKSAAILMQRTGTDYSSKPTTPSSRNAFDSLSASTPAMFIPRQPEPDEPSPQLVVLPLKPTASEQHLQTTQGAAALDESRDIDSSSGSDSKRNSDNASNSSGNKSHSSSTATHKGQTSVNVPAITEGVAATNDSLVPTIVLSENVYQGQP